MLKHCKHIFFDFDRTIWHFDANSEAVIYNMFNQYNLSQHCNIDFANFFTTYKQINHDLWAGYRKGTVTKEELRSSRFTNTLAAFNYDNLELGLKMEHEYIAQAPYQKQLLPNSIEVLDYLKPNYKLHIITNGFKEIQYIKLRNCDIEHYFDKIIISEDVGHHKPHQEIFEAALKQAGATTENSVMIGDDYEADIKGALNIGMPSIYLEFEKREHNESTFTIKDLIELKNLF